jgi:hypothetical protein
MDKPGWGNGPGLSLKGAAAAFTTESSSRITATVPAGASTGRVQVMPGGGR